jgi:hypothetical protein
MGQIPFSFKLSKDSSRSADPVYSPSIREQWQERFKVYYPDRYFTLRFHHNTSTMISCRVRYGRLELRLHRMFADASDEILQALAAHLRGSKKGTRLLDEFISKNRDLIKKRPKALLSKRQGRVYDLHSIAGAVNRVYFDGALDVSITWGNAKKNPKKKSIRLGSYTFEDQLIRIHPALDQSFVPAYVIVAVVYHEMLHHVLGIKRKDGRQYVHTAEFRCREQSYIFYPLARQWERQNLKRLL